MTWRDVQEIYIYYPPTHLQDNWGNQIIGKVIQPIVENYTVRWLWITRYLQPVAYTPQVTVPHEYQFSMPEVSSEPMNAFILFRLSVEDKSAQSHATELATTAGYYVSDWMDWDVVADLGSNRFIYSDPDDVERAERAHQIATFMSSTAMLLVSSLKEENGEWRIETNNDKEGNPHGNFFQSVHHLFCNTTEVPLFVQIRSPFGAANAQVRF